MSPVARDLLLYFAYMLAATSILSLPLATATLLAAKVAAPWQVALLGGAAAAATAVLDYHFVRHAFRLRGLAKLRDTRLFGRAERWSKVTPFWTTGIFAGFPLPFTVVRILVPLSGSGVARYASAVAIGRFCRFYVIAMFGVVFDIPTPVLMVLLVGGVALVALGALLRRLGWLRPGAMTRQGARDASGQ